MSIKQPQAEARPPESMTDDELRETEVTEADLEALIRSVISPQRGKKQPPLPRPHPKRRRTE